MELSNEIKNFIQSPDTLDFIVRSSDYLDEFIKKNPNITITQTLSGRYIIGYIDKSHYDDLLSYLSTSFISSAPVILGTLTVLRLIQPELYRFITNRILT